MALTGNGELKWFSAFRRRASGSRSGLVSLVDGERKWLGCPSRESQCSNSLASPFDRERKGNSVDEKIGNGLAFPVTGRAKVV